jgi:hypothetical protein
MGYVKHKDMQPAIRLPKAELDDEGNLAEDWDAI